MTDINATNIYDFMQKWKSIDLGQVFTPMHMASFASKLLDISDKDVVLDSSAGTGALLISAICAGCKEVYGIEFDATVYDRLKSNVQAIDDAKCDFLNADASTEDASQWIKSKPITKAILNPPYEKKYNTYGILLNTLKSLPVGCLVALFYPSNHLDKLEKEQKEQMGKHRILKIIELPHNLFSPFVSVQTSLFIIQANVPQEDYAFYGYKIEDDGHTRKKGKYRSDEKGKWRNELEQKYLNIVLNELEVDGSTRQNPKDGLYYRAYVDTTVTAWDLYKTVCDYMDWKMKQERDRIMAERKKELEKIKLY